MLEGKKYVYEILNNKKRIIKQIWIVIIIFNGFLSIHDCPLVILIFLLI